MRWIWIIIILIIIAGGAWWFGLFDKINSFSFSHFSSDQIAEKFNEPNMIKNQAGSIVEKITELPKKIINETAQQFKQSFIGSAKNEVGQVIDSVQQNLGLKAIAPVNERPLMMSLSGVMNKPIYFLIDGVTGEGAFVVDWGDGEQVSGKIENNEQKTIDHIWRAAGVYLVNAVISNKNNEPHRFSFPIYIQ
ncbi:MAG: hypothetical protein AAB847_02080 [Patescibacteria group bacterium]